jgi:release factor glutamine methyltransferase
MKVPAARVYATDISAAALEVAARNAERAGVAERVTFLEGEMLHPLRGNGLAGGVTALVSNPPYIPTGELAGLQAEVRDFEPREALDGGEDGLEFLRILVQDGPDLLSLGGFMALEVGDGQASTVAGLMQERFDGVEIHKDYAGRDRIVTGWKKAD